MQNSLKKLFTDLKQEPEYKWLYTVSNDVTKQSIKDAVGSYEKFFKKLSKFPKFKSKKRSRPSFYQDICKGSLGPVLKTIEISSQYTFPSQNKTGKTCDYTVTHIML